MEDGEGPGTWSFDMDGTEHAAPAATTGCCRQFGRACPCGGWQHYEAVYGGYYYQCERCGRGDDAPSVEAGETKEPGR